MFSATRNVGWGLHRQVMGTGRDQFHFLSEEDVFPKQWLPDGSALFINSDGRSFYRLSPPPVVRQEALLTTDYFKNNPRVSPDGRWVAYNSTESGCWEVYIASFPAFTDPAAGFEPRRRSGPMAQERNAAVLSCGRQKADVTVGQSRLAS
jgi:hypothetical protein